MESTTAMIEQSAAPPGVVRHWTALDLQARYYADIFAFFSRRIRPREEAEDLTATTFLAAFQGIDKIRNADARLFLYGIARRKLTDVLRKRRHLGKLAEAENLTSPDPGQAGTAVALREALQTLPADQAEALMLQNLEDLSLREIAQVMNRSEKSVKALLQRAKERLRSNSLLKSIAEEINV